MGRFGIRAIFWLTACVALGAWLLTLPPYEYYYEFPGDGITWLPELDFVERVSLATAVFIVPFAVAGTRRKYTQNPESFARDVRIVVYVLAIAWFLIVTVIELQ